MPLNLVCTLCFEACLEDWTRMRIGGLRMAGSSGCLNRGSLIVRLCIIKSCLKYPKRPTGERVRGRQLESFE